MLVMRNIVHVIIISLLVGCSLIVSANECQVREKYSPELWNGDPLKILAFTSEQDGFTCMLNFQRLDNYLFYDQIVLSNNRNKVIRTDHGNIEYLDIHSTLNFTGWNEITFSIDNNSTFMVTVRDKLVINYTVEYPVKTITTYGSNISLCSNPTWAVGENEAIVIPLYPRPQGIEGEEVLNPNNSSIYLTLSSTASFNPIIKVEGIKRFLTMKNGEILLSQDVLQPLRLNKYRLEVHTQKQKVNINCKLGNDIKKLMEFQVATVLSDIEISSQGMSFTVDLDLSSILIKTTTSTTITPITTTTPSTLTVATNDGTSTGLVVGIIITVFALLTLVVIIIFYKRRNISSMKTLKLDFHEERQQDDGSCRNNKSEMEIFIDDNNLISMHEEKQHYDGNYRNIIPEMVTLIGNKDDIRSQEVRQTVAKNDKINTNDAEKAFVRTEDKRSMEVRKTVAENEKINTNDAEKAFVRTEDKSFSDDIDVLEITSERQSDLKGKRDDSPENKEQYSGALPPNELQSTIGSSPGNNTLRDHPPPINQRPSLPRAELLQGHLPLGAQPPYIAFSTLQPAAVHPHTYKSSDNGEHRIDAPPEMSQSEIDKKIIHNESVSSAAIDRSNTCIASGEYGNARESLSTAIAIINQSEVANDIRCKTIIEILQNKHDEMKSKIDDMFNLNKTQPPHVPTSKSDILDQLSLYEAPSAGYQLQFPQASSSGNQISLPTNDSQSAGVLTQFYQNDLQQELGSTIKRPSNRRSNNSQYTTTTRSFGGDRNQIQVKPEENLEQLKRIGTDKMESEKTLLSTPGNFPTTIHPSNEMSHLPPNEHKTLEMLNSCEVET